MVLVFALWARSNYFFKIIYKSQILFCTFPHLMPYFQLVQETLLDEGLRVVKELVASHSRCRFDDASDRTTPPNAHAHRPLSSRSNHRLPFENFYDDNKVQVCFTSVLVFLFIAHITNKCRRTGHCIGACHTMYPSKFCKVTEW